MTQEDKLSCAPWKRNILLVEIMEISDSEIMVNRILRISLGNNLTDDRKYKKKQKKIDMNLL